MKRYPNADDVTINCMMEVERRIRLKEKNRRYIAEHYPELGIIVSDKNIEK